MDCFCSIDMDIDEIAETLKDKIITARKTHVCQECGEKIFKDEQYVYFSGVFDSGIFEHKTCLNCYSLRREFFDCYYFGRLWEDFIDYMGECYWEVPESCLSKVTKHTREKICWFIEKQWDEENDDDRN